MSGLLQKGDYWGKGAREWSRDLERGGGREGKGTERDKTRERREKKVVLERQESWSFLL